MKKNNASKIDMLNGPLLKKIILFAIPLAAGSILQQLFNAVDIAVVGHFASSTALAAVGANAPVISLLVNFFVGTSVGCTVLIGNYIGGGAEEKIPRVIHTAVGLSIIVGIILLLVGIGIAGPIHRLLATPEKAMDEAVLYLKIYCLGMPFFMIFNFVNAILRSVGDTKRPLVILAAAGIINVVLNLFFVIVCGMGVSGVAIATVISNVISSILMIVLLIKEEEPMHYHPLKTRIHIHELSGILKIGVPAGIQASVFSISNVCVQSSLNTFGADAVAAGSVGVTMEMIAFFLLQGFSQAATTFTAQNYGAMKADRCRRVLKLTVLCGLIACSIFDICVILLRYPMISIFTTDPSVAEFASTRLIMLLCLQPIVCTYEIPGQALRGMGRSLTPAVITIIGTCVLRVIWVFSIMKIHHTYRMLLAVYGASWMLTGIIMITVYIIITRKIYREMSLYAQQTL